MHIVRATNPPSMTVTVDTVVFGNIVLAVPPSHAEFKRIDLVVAVLDPKPVGLFGAKKQLAEVRYVPASMRMADHFIVPTQNGWRVLARIYVHPASTFIQQRNIEEVETYG